MQEEYLTVRETAKELNVHENQVYYAIKTKVIIPEKDMLSNGRGKGYAYKISRTDLEKLREALETVTVRTVSGFDDVRMVPPCRVCGRAFTKSGEYVVQRFAENGIYDWHPVCKNGICNMTQKQVSEISKLKIENSDLKLKNARMARELAKMRQQITNFLIHEGYEQQNNE